MKNREGKSRREKSKRGKETPKNEDRRGKIQARKMARKSRNMVFFQWLVGWEGGKAGKAAGAELCGQMRHENFAPFMEVWVSKMARRCGSKHISKSNGPTC